MRFLYSELPIGNNKDIFQRFSIPRFAFYFLHCASTNATPSKEKGSSLNCKNPKKMDSSSYLLSIKLPAAAGNKYVEPNNPKLDL